MYPYTNILSDMSEFPKPGIPVLVDPVTGNISIGGVGSNPICLATAPPVTNNYATLSIGGGAWDGIASAAFFAPNQINSGNVVGCSFAINEASGFSGSLIQCFVAGFGTPLSVMATGYVGIGTSNPSAQLQIHGSLSSVNAQAWGVNGIGLRIDDNIYTDTSTSASGTVTTSGIHAIAQPHIAATNAPVTYSVASTLYIAGPPTASTNITITTPYSLHIATGNVYFAGFAGFGVAPTATLHVNASVNMAAWTTNGIGLKIAASLPNDTSSTGTVAANYINVIGQATISATHSGVTYTNAVTLYIDNAPTSGANVTITNPYALYINAGKTYIGAQVGVTATPDSASLFFISNTASTYANSLNVYMASTDLEASVVSYNQGVFTLTSASKSNAYGISCEIITAPATSRTLTNCFGVYSILTFKATGGTVTNAYATYSACAATSTGGALTNAYALLIGAWADNSGSNSGSPTVTTSYGIYVKNQGAGTSGLTITNATNLYVEAASGAGTNNYTAIFAGGVVGFGTTSPAAQIHIAGGLTAAAWGTSGLSIRSAAATFTDSSTAAGATVTNAMINTFAQPTVTATNATSGSKVTYTNLATVYIANSPTVGANTLVTNAYALYVAAGQVYFANGMVANPRVGTETTNSATAINAGLYDQWNITALAGSDTIGAPTGGVDGQNLLIRIKDNGTSQTLAWNSIFRVIGSSTVLPTATVISKWAFIFCKYNAADTKWDVLAVGQQ